MQKSKQLEFSLLGKTWRITRPSDLESLWDAIGTEEFLKDERLPYWVELWPSSFVLAEWVARQRERIAGCPCLDIGCGLGVVAMVGALAGAKVVAFDYEEQALFYARENACVNATPPVHWVVMDWREPAITPRAFKFGWAADIMYEKRFIEPVSACIAHALAPEGCLWIAEPCRPVYSLFNDKLHSYGLGSTLVEKKQITALEGHTVTVNLWEIRQAKA